MDALRVDELWVAHQPGGSDAKAGFSSFKCASALRGRSYERGFMASESFGVPCLDYTYGESQLHVLN